MSTPARIMSDFERGKISYRKMQKMLARAAIKRGKRAEKRAAKNVWK